MAERSSTQTPTTRTRRRRSSTTSNCLSRSILRGCFTDGTVSVAEARKEIANALQLHRSSNNSNTSVAATKNDYGGGGATSDTASAVSNVCSCCGGCRCVADCTSSTLDHHPQYCDFSSAASMNKQLPAYSYLLQPSYLVSQPVWSTTSPSVFPTPSFATTATDHSAGDVVYNICDEQQQQEDQVIDWGDKLADSSYTWWFGFLKSLDGSGGGGANGVLLSNNGADQISMQQQHQQQQQQQEIYREDQNLSSHEHHEWLIEPEAASN